MSRMRAAMLRSSCGEKYQQASSNRGCRPDWDAGARALSPLDQLPPSWI